MRIREMLLAAALVMGCSSETPTINASGEIVLKQELIEFPRAFVGYKSTADLVVQNSGFSSIPIELGLEGPFAMARGNEMVPGGAILRLPIHFAPKQARTFTGKVFVRVGDTEHEVPLVGVAETPPPCKPSALCREVEFDPGSGDCRESVSPDHTTCKSGNLCVENEFCFVGECVGAPKDCNDGSVCTEDACDPARGCVNVDTVTPTCPQSANPCEVGTCHPTLGCLQAAVPDGTLCGAADCRSAMMCVGAECGEYDVPDGTPCIDACGEGKCDAGECERPNDDQLKQLWSYRPVPGTNLQFAGTVDPAGQLYWIEERAGRRDLVSSTAGGVIRYSVPLGVQQRVSDRGIALEDGLVLVASATTPVALVHLTRDGSSPWLRDLSSHLTGHFDGAAVCPCTVTDGSITRSEPGRALYAASVSGAGDAVPTRTFLAMLRTGSGEVAWTEVVDGALVAPPIADEAGNLYFLVQSAGLGPEDVATLFSFDPAGEERWRVAATGDAPALAVWDGKVHQALDTLLAAASGEESGTLGYTAKHAAGPLHGEAGSWAFTRESDGSLLARPFDPAGMARPVITLLAGADLQPLDNPGWTEPILTRRDTALISTSMTSDTGAWEPLLRELMPDGDVRRTCRLGVDAPVRGATSLRGGKWVVQAQVEGVRQLHAFDLPLADPAVRGWVGPFGHPAGGGRSQ